MIAASEPQEFVPRGRQQASLHPDCSRQSALKTAEHYDLVLNQLERVSLSEQSHSEWWLLRRYPADDKTASKKGVFEGKLDAKHLEEELYVRGSTVVWSRGLVNPEDTESGRKVLCCYTLQSAVKHALWCEFYCERPSFDESVDVEEPAGVAVPSVCLIDSNNIRVFTEKGEDFMIAIPFQIGGVFATKFGILIEKEPEKDVKESLFENQANVFSLAYPLDDICPLAIYYQSSHLMSSHMHVSSNSKQKIVFTCDSPSICMMYDSQTKQHSVYFIRKVRRNEKGFSSCPSNTSSSKLKSRFSMWDNVISGNNMVVPSPAGSKASAASFLHQSRSHSSMATISRCQSPAVSSVGSPWLMQSSRLNTSFQPMNKSAGLPASNRSYFDCQKSMSHLRSSPAICLDYLWTDTFSVQEPLTAGPASKVFLCDDLTDQWYLCYILPSRFQLSVVRVDFSQGSNIQFGVLTSISAKDAVPIPKLHMLAILEHSGNVCLYSGMTLVGKVHIGGTLAKHTPSPFARRNQPQFNSPFPRRSSLLPNCKQSDPKFDEHLLSPVLPSTTSRMANIVNLHDVCSRKAVLTGLSDPIENRLSLRYSDGTCYRVALPPLARSSLVSQCLNVLRQTVGRDAVLTFFARWYSSRNGVGSGDFSSKDEWRVFLRLLFELIGYEDYYRVCGPAPGSPSAKPKRARANSKASKHDWNHLYACEGRSRILDVIHMKRKNPYDWVEFKEYRPPEINCKALLFRSFYNIFYAFHLFYEELKLDRLRAEEAFWLARALSQLARDFELKQYVVYYWCDWPELGGNSEDYKKSYRLKRSMSWVAAPPISLLGHIQTMLMGCKTPPYPHLTNVNERSNDLVEVIGLLADEGEESIEQVVLSMVERGFTVEYLSSLPSSLYLLLYSVLWKVREAPPPGWPNPAYNLMWREDLAAQTTVQQEFCKQPRNPLEPCEDFDGLDDLNDEVFKFRFSEDVRVQEAKKMLQSSQAVPINLVQRPDVSDHDFIEEQEKHLYAICTRTMALPVGRGMITLRSSSPLITEPLRTPVLNLTGRAAPRGTTVELTNIDTPPHMRKWPLFHNGVANGLRITTTARNITDTWITFNKPKNVSPNEDDKLEHAGFLMALGLNAHLHTLSVLNRYEYLIHLQDLTSVGVLLGLAAAFRGSAHFALTKTLSIHIEALLPPTSMELDVPQNLQVAALLGIGLLYQKTAHRHMTEILLNEINRPPGPEMDNSTDRESYSLSAGLALGLVTLRQGDQAVGLSDLNLPDTLHYYMIGGNKRPLTGAQKDKYKVPSFQIREGSTVNLDVTAPGATLALGLMYLQSNNKSVADWMAPPSTQYLLDFVRPDFLMLRTLSRALILWDDIEPSKKWVEGQVPDSILPYCMVKPSPLIDVDYEAMNQAYCNIVSGACFGLGLRYAGTGDEDAFQTLLYYCHMFTSLTGKSIAELAGKPTIETCLNVVLVSVAMVMAGTGSLEVLRLCRHLRRRVGIAATSVVTYGSHMAIHMALGLLFLGGGLYSLSNSPESIAALICAFYPKYPTHSNDNRYHLQAFRHLYVLAVELRLVIPRNVNSNVNCYASLRLVKLDGSIVKMQAPGLLPDLSTLRRVQVEDERYWPVVFERGRNWDLLMKIVSSNGVVAVKQRAGCLSYSADKFGYKSQLARTLTQSGCLSWDSSPGSIQSFTSDLAVWDFCEHFLIGPSEVTKVEAQLREGLTRITYEAVVKDKLIGVLIGMALFKIIDNVQRHPNPGDLVQLKLIKSLVLEKGLCNLLAKEAVLSACQQVEVVLDQYYEELDVRLATKNYLFGFDFIGDKAACLVTYYDLPFGEFNGLPGLEGLEESKTITDRPFELFVRLKDRFNAPTMLFISKCFYGHENK